MLAFVVQDADSAEIALGALARRQSGVFTRAEAVAAGVPAHAVARRLRSGLWITEYGGAIRAATTPITRSGRERAALVRAGAGAALSHLSAARRWALGTPEPDEVWITVPATRNPRPTAGIRVIRSRHISAEAIRLVDGIPVLDVPRTVADLARVLNQNQLTAAILTAMQRQLCDLEELKYWQRTLAGRPGSALLRRAIEEADPALESILAAEFDALMRGAGIALMPRYALALPDGRSALCDFADPIAKIDFEVDGFAYHSAPHQVARDRARDRRLLAAGWVTVRYDTHDIRRRPRATVADVRRQQAIRLAQRA